MILTGNDYINIAAQIEEGGNCIEYKKDGEWLFFDFELWQDGYVEDDYEKGTGAFVRTDLYLSITNCEVMDKDENITPFDLDEEVIKKYG